MPGCRSIVVGVAGALLLADAARAVDVRVSGYAQAGVPEQGAVEETFLDERLVAPATGSAQAASALPGDTVSAAAATQVAAEYGLFDLTATASATGGAYFQFPASGGLAQGVANPQLRFRDTIRVLAPDPSLSFLPGTLVVRVLAATTPSGSGAATPVGDGARVEWTMNVGLGTCPSCFDGASGRYTFDAIGITVEGPELPAVFESQPLPFRFDQPTTLELNFSTIATARATGIDPLATSTAELAGEVRWGGVVSVSAGSGVRATSGDSLPCAIESLSGVDWCQAVPEADGTGLAAAALLLLAAAARARS